MYYLLKRKKINFLKQKRIISSNIQRLNYLPFLLHNFTGFLTLDAIIKNIHKGVLSKNKLFVFSGNVVKFEYRYKFDEINLRALKPKQNELFIYIDFGLKRILQFNSKQFYLSKDKEIETSDRVNALFYKLDTHFEDELIWSCSFNVKNLNNFTKRIKNNGLLSLPSVNLNLHKFFVDDFILKNSFFCYTTFVQQLMVHAFYVQFFNFNLFNFYYSSFIYGLNTNFTFKSFNNAIYNFLNVLYVDTSITTIKGFMWYQQRVKGYYPYKHAYYIKTAPYLLRRRLYKAYHNEQFNLKRKKNRFFKKHKSIFSKKLNYVKKLKIKKLKLKFLLTFILNLLRKKGRFWLGLTKFKLSILQHFFYKTKILYFLKLKKKANYVFKFKKLLRLFCKKYKQYTFNLAVSSALNNNQKKVPSSFFINNLFYIDSGFIVEKKNKKSRLFNRFRFVKKKVFLVKKLLRKIFVKKLIDVKRKQKKKLLLKFKIKTKKIVKSKTLVIKNVFSKRTFIKSLTNLLSINQQFQFRHWLEHRFNSTIAYFFGVVPFAFLYKGFVKNKMYLFYKKNFALLCNQLEFLHLVLRYFWLTSYLKSLILKNITKLQQFKIKKDSLNFFSFKLSLNDYLIKLIKAFGYTVVIKMQNFDFMTSQLAPIIAPAAQKKMKFFWRTIKREVVPSMIANFTKLYNGSLIFLRFSLIFVMFYNYFLYHKRFNFKIGICFWKKFLRLKENFNLLFLKETPTNFVLSKDYYKFFYKMISKHNLLFCRLLFYLKTYLQSKQINIASLNLNKMSAGRILFFLKSIIFFKKNIFNFSVFFFFNFFYKLNLKFNIFFSSTKNLVNYSKIYNKLFYTINPVLKIKVLHKKKLKFSSNFQQFFFNVKSIKNVFSYNHLLNIWSWHIFNLFIIATGVILPDKFSSNKIITNKFAILNLTEKTLLLFDLKLKQNKINSFEIKFNRKNREMAYFNQANIKNVRCFSTKVTFIKQIKPKSSKNLFTFILLNKKKNWLRKKIKFLKHYHSIFVFFNKYKKTKFFYSYCFLKKVNNFNKIYINKKRLHTLFKYTNLFDNFSFLIKLINVLIFKFKIKNFYKNFLVKYILISIFKNNIVLQFKDFRFIFISIIYVLICSFKKKVTNNLWSFIRQINNICKKLTKNAILQTTRTLKYLNFFTNKINFMFFRNIKSISGLFSKQMFHLFGKFKTTLNLNKFNIIVTSRFVLNKEKNNFIYDLFNFRSKLLTNYNNIFFYLNKLGFCYLTKISIINLFFFKKVNFNQLNFPVTKKLKNFFVKCSTLTFNNELKRLHFFVYVLNILLKKFFFNNKKNTFNFKKLFWVFNLMTFNVTLKANRFKKKLLFKYNYPFFLKGKQKNVGTFTRKFFLKKQYKLFRFVYNYGGSRFCKHTKKFNIHKKVKRILTKTTVSKENFSKFLRWLKQTSKTKRANIFFKRKDLKNQYQNYIFIKSSLHNTFKSKLFAKSLRKLGFRVSPFFLWAIPKKNCDWRKSRCKNSVRRLLWTKGKAYHLNKLSFIKHILYSYSSPFKIRYSFRRIKPLDDDLKWFHFVYKFINPSKQYILRTYNINNFLGYFLKYPKKLCLTRKKQKQILKKKTFLRFLVRCFRRQWAQRLWYSIRPRKIIARGDSIWFLKYYTRKIQSKKFYFMSKFFFALTKIPGLKFLMDPFSKRIKYKKFFLRYKPYSRQASLAKEKKKKASEKATRRKWPYFRLLRRFKRKRRRTLILKKTQKKIVVRYNKFFLNKSMRNFWFASKKKIQPSFRIYSNLMPWNNTKNSGKILALHNNLFTKYRKAIELWNKQKYLSDPILFKHFKNMKNSKFFKLSDAQKRKFEKFRNLKREKKFRNK